MSKEPTISGTQAAEILVMYRAVFQADDLPSKILRLHALTEWYIERLLTVRLRAPEQILAEGKFNYGQKLAILIAMGALPIKVGDALRRLSKLRNKCAHEMFPEVTDEEILDAAQPILKEFKLTLQDHETDKLKRDTFHVYAWSLFTELSLQVAPLEEVMGKSIWSDA